MGVFDVSGEVAPASIGSVLAANDDWIRMAGIAAQVVSYRNAKVGIEPDSLCRSVLTAAKGPATEGIAVPTALIVREDDAEMWRLYCWLMAQHGIQRQAFTSVEEAFRWTRDRAVLVEAQRRYRSLWQSRQ